MIVLCTILDFLATGSPSTSPGDLELVHVLLLLSIFLIFETIDTRILDNRNKETKTFVILYHAGWKIRRQEEVEAR